MFEPATRAEALRRLERFAPQMGRTYAARRNFDTGPGLRENVSQLSPFIARRLITEEEAVTRALTAHSPSACEKFVQEVLWRTYFKGWLEHRPGVWEDYKTGLLHDLETVPEGALNAALEGETGIAAFDAWAHELVNTGYLHNHARMWFASIWIFTLRLPWRIGADFFLRHLIDGDAASNTLSWRWVAGLHTQGKNYAARAPNIAKYTEGRFPQTAGLATDPAPLEDGGLPARQALRRLRTPDTTPALYVITSEDLCPGIPASLDTRAVTTLNLSGMRSPLQTAPHLNSFDHAALQDAAERITAASLAGNTPEALIALANRHGARQIVTAFRHQGWVQDWFLAAQDKFEAAGLTVAEHQRAWDQAFHPHAKSGFFGLKKKIPQTLGDLGIGPSAMPLFAQADVTG